MAIRAGYGRRGDGPFPGWQVEIRLAVRGKGDAVGIALAHWINGVDAIVLWPGADRADGRRDQTVSGARRVVVR